MVRGSPAVESAEDRGDEGRALEADKRVRRRDGESPWPERGRAMRKVSGEEDMQVISMWRRESEYRMEGRE